LGLGLSLDPVCCRRRAARRAVDRVRGRGSPGAAGGAWRCRMPGPAGGGGVRAASGRTAAGDPDRATPVNGGAVVEDLPLLIHPERHKRCHPLVLVKFGISRPIVVVHGSPEGGRLCPARTSPVPPQ